MKEPTDFSLVLGGSLFQILRRSHLAGDTLQLLRRCVITLALLAWLPLLLLSIVEGLAWGNRVKLPYELDWYLDWAVNDSISLPQSRIQATPSRSHRVAPIRFYTA